MLSLLWMTFICTSVLMTPYTAVVTTAGLYSVHIIIIITPDLHPFGRQLI